MRQLIIVGTLALLCACTPGATKVEGKVAVAGIDVALCILAHSADPVPQIIATCGAENEQQILNLFAAAQRANRRGFSVRPPLDELDAGR